MDSFAIQGDTHLKAPKNKRSPADPKRWSLIIRAWRFQWIIWRKIPKWFPF
jgi:hypothetical protein